jgi:outer membrane protein OmpA-like peptidoglycan-associated protein/tetratricopeptide (TPR) repeat protein
MPTSFLPWTRKWTATAAAGLLLAPAVQGQAMLHRMADKYAAQFDFNSMAKVYEDIVAKPSAKPADYRKLAFAYKKAGNTPQAAATYKRLLDLGSPASDDMHAYADLLRAQGRYAEAVDWYRKYAAEEPEDNWVQAYLKNGDLFLQLRADSLRNNVRPLALNSTQADLGPALMGDLLIFSSARGQGAGGSTPYKWDDQPFLNLYTAMLTGGVPADPLVMRHDVNSRYHDGTATFDPYMKRLYFTRNNFSGGKITTAKNGELKLGIYYSEVRGGETGAPEWGPLTPFLFNDPNYNFGQPCMAPNGQRIYFVSDKPGGIGGTDIWYSDRVNDDWTEPMNMGPAVNTPGGEMYPFITKDSTFYFSSTGQAGLGGFDLFTTTLGPAGPGKVLNLGYPMNTASNDYALVLTADDSTGFFVSDRPGGQGSDDIYACTVRPPRITIQGSVVDKMDRSPLADYDLTVLDAHGQEVRDALVERLPNGGFKVSMPYGTSFTLKAAKDGYRPAQITLDPATDDLANALLELEKNDYGAEGIVYNGNDRSPLAGVNVHLTNTDGELLQAVVTGADGRYSFGLKADSDYRIRTEKDGFFKQSARITSKGKGNNTVIHTDFNLFPLEVDQVVRLDNIYYDLAKWNIRPDAAKELDKLVQTLSDNPTVRIELSSHTDCRGKDAYNLSLSEKRAKSAVEYLIKQGIAADRLAFKGYGETKPVESCDCAKCTEDQHQANRRTEFKVLSK